MPSGNSKLAAVPVRILNVPVTSLAACRLDMTQARDFLFQGF
ncbi:CcdB family protein [Methylococcus geothermalis]|nr:CcdB family protein [Methylococcus geothermalis]